MENGKQTDRFSEEWKVDSDPGKAGTSTLVGSPAPLVAEVVGGRSELGLRVLHQLMPLGDRSAAFAGIVRQILGAMLSTLVRAGAIDRLNCEAVTLQQLIDCYRPGGRAAETAENKLLRAIFNEHPHYPEPSFEIAMSLDYAVRRAIDQDATGVVSTLVELILTDCPEHAGRITTAMMGVEASTNSYNSYPLIDSPYGGSRPLKSVPLVNEQQASQYSLLGALARIVHVCARKHADVHWTSLISQYRHLSVTDNWHSELLILSPDGQPKLHDGWHLLKVRVPPFNTKQFEDSASPAPLACVLAHLAAASLKRNHPVVAYRSRSLPLDGAFVTLCAGAWRFVRLMCMGDSEEARHTRKLIAGLLAIERTLWTVLASSGKRPIGNVLNWLGECEQRGLIAIEDRQLFVGALEITRPLMLLAPCPRGIQESS